MQNWIAAVLIASSSSLLCAQNFDGSHNSAQEPAGAFQQKLSGIRHEAKDTAATVTQEKSSRPGIPQFIDSLTQQGFRYRSDTSRELWLLYETPSAVGTMGYMISVVLSRTPDASGSHEPTVELHHTYTDRPDHWMTLKWAYVNPKRTFPTGIAYQEGDVIDGRGALWREDELISYLGKFRKRENNLLDMQRFLDQPSVVAWASRVNNEDRASEPQKNSQNAQNPNPSAPGTARNVENNQGSGSIPGTRDFISRAEFEYFANLADSITECKRWQFFFVPYVRRFPESCFSSRVELMLGALERRLGKGDEAYQVLSDAQRICPRKDAWEANAPVETVTLVNRECVRTSVAAVKINLQSRIR